MVTTPASDDEKTIRYDKEVSESVPTDSKTRISGPKESSQESLTYAVKKLAIERTQSVEMELEPEEPKRQERKFPKRAAPAVTRRVALEQQEIEKMIRDSKGKITKELGARLDKLGTKITTLNLKGIKINASKMANIAKKLPNLHELSLSEADDETMKSVAKLSKLTHLDVSHSENITDSGLSRLEKLQDLAVLNLTGCSNVQGEVITLVEHIRALKTVKLQGCSLFIQGKWLHNFLKKQPAESYVVHILALYKELINESGKPLPQELQIIERVIKRYENLKKSGFEKEPLKAYQILKLAYFIEARLPKMEMKTTHLFSRKKFDLPRSLLYIHEEGKVHIRARRQFARLFASGSSKDVVDAVEVVLKDQSLKPKPVAWTATKIRSNTGRLLKQKAFALSLKEAYLIRDKLKGVKNIAQVFYIFDYKKTLIGSKEVPRAAIISERFDSNFTFFINEAYTKPTFQTVLTLATGAASGLANLHALRIVQGDFKAANCLYRTDPVSGKIVKIAITDLGLAFDVDEEDPTLAFINGFYGTIANTSPEQLGVTDFSGDFFATDVFAFGVMLYSLYFKKRNPPWAADITNYYTHVFSKSGHDPQKLQACREAVLKKIEKHVEEPLRKLQSRGRWLTNERRFEYLIYSALRANPDDRIKMPALMEQLNNLFQSERLDNLADSLSSLDVGG